MSKLDKRSRASAVLTGQEFRTQRFLLQPVTTPAPSHEQTTETEKPLLSSSLVRACFLCRTLIDVYSHITDINISDGDRISVRLFEVGLNETLISYHTSRAAILHHGNVTCPTSRTFVASVQYLRPLCQQMAWGDLGDLIFTILHKGRVHSRDE